MRVHAQPGHSTCRTTSPLCNFSSLLRAGATLSRCTCSCKVELGTWRRSSLRPIVLQNKVHLSMPDNGELGGNLQAALGAAAPAGRATTSALQRLR